MNGDTLWAWQSQQPDGSWSVIAMFAATAEQARTSSPEQLRAHHPELMVLLHRDGSVARGWRGLAQAHSERFGQPIRFARFELALIAEEIEGR